MHTMITINTGLDVQEDVGPVGRRDEAEAPHLLLLVLLLSL